MHRSTDRRGAQLRDALVVSLALVAACSDQVTQVPTPKAAGSEPSAARAPFKSVFALNPLIGSGATLSFTYDINDLGQAVGASSGNAGERAVIWDQSDVPLDLGLPSGMTNGYAMGISNDGKVIVGAVQDATFVSYAARWLKVNGQWTGEVISSANCNAGAVSSDGTAIVGRCGNSAVVWLNGRLITLGIGFVAYGVNRNGQAVGTNNSGDHALVWNFFASPVAATDLGTLGGAFAVANDINDAGEITGWSENADHVSHAYLWSPKKNVMIDLGTPGVTSGGYAINETGQVVGDVWPNGTPHAGFFDHGKVVDLGVLPGYDNAVAIGINDNGAAVGYSYTSNSLFRGTQWIVK